MVLSTFKDQLQQHVRVHAVEAVMACCEIENTLQALTGLSLPLFISSHARRDKG
uniref:KNOX2 domain-containing protein n=1 Tax=Rhizophora mucronata TaxID=61149 RepID=A0A2P2LEW4_RHIMU